MKLKTLPKFYLAGIRFPRTVLVISLMVTILGLWASKKLTIETSFNSILPQKTDSVQNLKELKHYFGSIGSLVVTVEAEETQKAEGFADAFSKRIGEDSRVRYVDFRRPVDFFKQRQWLYLDMKDLQEMERRIDRSLELEKKGVSPVFSGMMDFADENDRPDLTFKDIRKKYEEKMKGQGEALSSGEDGRLLILWVKPKDSAENIEKNRRLMADIKKMEADLRSHGDYASVKVGYTGEYESGIEEFDMTTRQIALVSILVSAILLLILFLYFKRASGVFLVSVPLAMGVIWTGGLTYLFLGHVNMITGFAAGILAGLGSDYGIYLLTRFYTEKDAGEDFLTCCRRTFSNTGRATFGSMLTTVGGFGALLFSNFKVFTELGLVGALGLIMNYWAMVLVIPAFLTLGERYQKNPFFVWMNRYSAFRMGEGKREKSFVQALFSPTQAAWVVAGVVFLCGLCALTIADQSKIYFEDGQMDTQSLPSNRLYGRVSKVTGGTLKPTVLIVQGLEEGRRTVDVLNREIETQPKDSLVYNRVLGISTFIPENDEEKRPQLQRILEKYQKSQLVNKSQKAKVLSSLRETLASEPVTAQNLPVEVTRNFRSSVDPNVYAVYLFPSLSRTTSEKMALYHHGVMGAREKTGGSFIPVDGAFVSLDVIRLIEKEAPVGFFLVILFLGLFLFLTIHPFRRALMILLHLLAGLVILSGVLWILEIRLNVMNIAMIPIILGTGIDCFLHFSHRYDECETMGQALHLQIPSILISNLTTMVGFGGLLFTSSMGLRSVGWVAVLGLAVMTLLCVFVFPRILVLQSIRRLKILKVEEDAAQA
jgi:uncharacterized protein